MQGWRRSKAVTGLVALAFVVGACGSGEPTITAERSPDPAVAPAAADPPAATSPTTVTVPTTTPATPPPTTTTTTTTTTAPPLPREVVETGYSPFATVGGIVLHHPAARVETIGFHESNHEGARQQEVVATAARPMTLETRGRGTGDRTAADVVVDPDVPIVAPVTGTVRRAGGYTLYCDNTDEYVVIEPDAQPGWEVKVLHVVGVQVGVGQRVEAGVTPLAVRGNVLPFASQVDEFTAEPSWPHAHIEVVDPSIPNIPSPGSGSEDC